MDAGAILIVIVVVFVLPPIFLMLGAAVSAAIGLASRSYAERKHAGSELIDTNY